MALCRFPIHLLPVCCVVTPRPKCPRRGPVTEGSLKSSIPVCARWNLKRRRRRDQSGGRRSSTPLTARSHTHTHTHAGRCAHSLHQYLHCSVLIAWHMPTRTRKQGGCRSVCVWQWFGFNETSGLRLLWPHPGVRTEVKD